MRKRLLIEGWRQVPHSYGLVAQAHCLCLLERDDVELRFLDLPYFLASWQRTSGLSSPEQEHALMSIREPEATFVPDATFRLWPERPNFSAPDAGRKFVFATAEYRVLLDEYVNGYRSAGDVPDSVDVITPSQWSAHAFTRFGMAPERVHILPHGIDPRIYCRDETSRAATRQHLAIGDDFLFMSVGAMTWNKGLDVLLAAFSRVLEKRPSTRLLLKGVDALYPSKSYVQEVVGDLPAPARNAVARRLIYVGGTFSMARMGDILRAADCYVSPYRAEGFNLPVLEAAACGVPVLCTAGGPTDEFTDPASTLRIRSTPGVRPLTATQTGDFLVPDVDHLVDLMLYVADDPPKARELGAQAALHTHRHFTWDKVTDRLVTHLFPVH